MAAKKTPEPLDTLAINLFLTKIEGKGPRGIAGALFAFALLLVAIGLLISTGVVSAHAVTALLQKPAAP